MVMRCAHPGCDGGHAPQPWGSGAAAPTCRGAGARPPQPRRNPAPGVAGRSPVSQGGYRGPQPLMSNPMYRLKGDPLEPLVRPDRSRSDLDCQRQSNLYRCIGNFPKGELARPTKNQYRTSGRRQGSEATSGCNPQDCTRVPGDRAAVDGRLRKSRGIFMASAAPTPHLVQPPSGGNEVRPPRNAA